MEACENLKSAGKLDEANTIIESSCRLELDYANDDGNTPLHWAAYFGQVALAERLIRQGANVDVKNRLQATALHAATRYGRLDVARLLIREGADVNARGQFGHSPITLAATQNHVDIAKLLLNNGGMMQEQTLTLAASNEDGSEMVNTLLAFGADINNGDEQGNTALMTACLCGNELVVKTITDSPDENTLRVDARNNTGWTAAHWAFSDPDMARRKRVVDMLIARGGNDILIVKDNEGNKPNDVRPKRATDGSPRKKQKVEMPVPDEDFWRTE